MKDKKSILICMLTSGMLSVTVFLLAFFISGMLPGQKFYFLHGDGYAQILPYAKLFWRNLFEGKSLQYSFETGLGMPTVAIYAFDVLSPFYVFLSVIPDIEVAAVVIVCAKLMCAVMSMCLLLKTELKTDFCTTMIFSVAYGLCSFFCSFFLSFFMLDMMYVLPVIVIGIRRLVRDGKWGALCLAYVYSFVVQFYCAYMTGIFSAVIFVAYAWFCYGKTYDLWKKAVLRFFLCVLTAVLIAAPVLLPAAYELFSLYASDTLKLDDFSLMPWSFMYGFYPGYLGQLQNSDNSAPLMYAGIPAALLTIMFFLDRSNTVRERILAGIPVIFLVLCSFIKPLYLLMHAFDAPNFYAFRFSWMMSFMIIVIAAKEIKHVRNGSTDRRLMWGTAIGWIAGYFLIFLLEKLFNTPEAGTLTLYKGALAAAVTVIYVILFSGVEKDKWKIIAAGGVLMIELAVNILCGQAYVQDTLAVRDIYTAADRKAKESMSFINDREAESPWEFYRVRYLNSITDNISMVYGFRGLGWFCSIENEKVRRMLEDYGYATKNLMANDYGSTPFMQMIFAQKYDIEYCYYTENNDEKTVLRQNDHTLPLGFKVSKEMAEYTTPSGSPFENQNALASAMCGKEHEIYKMHEGQYYVEPVNLELAQYENGIHVHRTAEEGTVVYSFEPEYEGNAYAYMRRWGSTLYMKEAPLLYSEADIGGMGKLSRVCMPHVIPIGIGEDGLYHLYLYMSRDSIGDFDYEALYFAYEDKNEIEAVYNELMQGAMDVTSFRDDRIEATVNAGPEGGLLFTSIPYSRDWTVYVDGAEKESIAVLDGTFLGAELDGGEHKLLLVYRQKRFFYGIACSLAGILLFFVCYARNKKNRA